MNDINALQQRNRVLYGGLGTPPQQKKKSNVVSQALKLVTNPIRQYKPFGLKDAQTGLKAMFRRNY